MSRGLLALLMFAAGAALAQPAGTGKAVYEKGCNVCHAAGLANAPRVGNAQDWAPRVARGIQELYKVAIQGNLRGMPPKGGRTDLSDAEVRAAVDYMVGASRGAAATAEKKPPPVAAAKEAIKPPAAATKTTPAAAATAAPPAAAAAASPASAVASATTPAVSTSAATKAPVAAAAAAAGTVVASLPPSARATTGDAASEVNAFNRLLRPPARRNAPPAEDGIHDPQFEGTLALQPPLASFANLPKLGSGNGINWVSALNEKRIQPRWDKSDPNAQAVVMDLNIVREVKGTMPDVLYPHKQHTEWLDCSNCHPAIFEPKKGANQISMAAILLGQKCGVCHGKVAFPVSECRLCHSQRKDTASARSEAKR